LPQARTAVATAQQGSHQHQQQLELHAQATATGPAGVGSSASGRLVRVDSALDARQVLEDAQLQGSALDASLTPAAAAGGLDAGSGAGSSAHASTSLSRGVSGGHAAAGDQPSTPGGRPDLEASSLLLVARRVVLGGQGPATPTGRHAAGASGSAAAGPPALHGPSAAVAAGDSGSVYPDDVELYPFADSLHDEHSLAAARQVVLGGAGTSGLSSSGSSRRTTLRPVSPDERAQAGASSSRSSMLAGAGRSTSSELPAARPRPLAGTSSLPARSEYVLDSPRERAAAANSRTLYDLD
jgi:hypothetical protein